MSRGFGVKKRKEGRRVGDEMRGAGDQAIRSFQSHTRSSPSLPFEKDGKRGRDVEV